MKKFIFSFMAIVAIASAMSSCNGKTCATANDADSTDTTVVVDSDSVALDSVMVCED